MSPPPPMLCSSEECSYETPSGIPTYELLMKALDLHIQAVHRRNNGSTQAVAVKTERPKRPSLSVGLSESDWAFLAPATKCRGLNNQRFPSVTYVGLLTASDWSK